MRWSGHLGSWGKGGEDRREGGEGGARGHTWPPQLPWEKLGQAWLPAAIAGPLEMCVTAEWEG